MTVPAQPASGSAAAPASGSAPASVSPVTIAKDTVTTGTSVTGLAGVLAEADAAHVAEGIARAVTEGLRQAGQPPLSEIRVIGDLSALADLTTRAIMQRQVEQFTQQVSDYVGAVPDTASAAPPPRTDAPDFRVTGFLGLGADTIGSILGTVTQLMAGTYTYSGQAIPNASIGGLDILIARELAGQTEIPVRVDRFAVGLRSDIVDALQGLATKAASDLNPALARADSAAQAAAQAVADDKDRLAQLSAALAAASKGSTVDVAALQRDYDQVFAEQPAKDEAGALAQSRLTEGKALAAAVAAFISGAVTAPAAGGPTPVARAAHGELLNRDGSAILYAQVIAAGDDQVLRQTLLHNTWSNLTGVTAEYALLLPGSEDALAYGLETAFAVTHGSVRKAMTDIARKPVTLRHERPDRSAT